ncbi:hypothetical protein ACMT90_14815 [Clavibacter sp. Sh2126]
MVKSEQQIIQELIHKWVPLALEFCQGAPGVTAVFVYAGSELGSMHANAFFEQSGAVIYPDDLKGATRESDVFELQDLLMQDLLDAERDFREAVLPCPTEYRITYEPGPGRLDMQLSHEIKYANHPTKILEDGPEDWLEGRLEKHFGKLMPTEEQRREWQ